MTKLILALFVLIYPFFAFGAENHCEEQYRDFDISMTGISDKKAVVRLLLEIDVALRNEGLGSLSNYVNMPIIVNIGKQKILFETRNQYISYFEKRREIHISDDIYENGCLKLWANWSGISIGRGAIWIANLSPTNDPENFRLKIVTLNINP